MGQFVHSLGDSDELKGQDLALSAYSMSSTVPNALHVLLHNICPANSIR